MPKIKARFMRVKGGENLRTNFVEGYYREVPEEGKGFKFYAKALEGPGARYIYTSNVVKIEWMVDKKGFLIFTATGSVYMVDIHEN